MFRTLTFSGLTVCAWATCVLAGAAAVPGDVDGDGRADLIFRDQVPLGSNFVYAMDGNLRLATKFFQPSAPVSTLHGDPAAELPPPLPNWEACGVGDFDRDGINDVVFQDLTGALGGQIWLMDAGLVRRSAVAFAPPGGMHCKGVHDMNGDGWPDLLWATPQTNAPQTLLVRLMNGTTPVSEVAPSPAQAASSAWRIVAVADFDGDTHPDLLWWNNVSGRTVLWYLDASLTRVGSRFTNPVDQGGATWEARAVADFGQGPARNQPPTVDIVWRNNATGELVVWWMDRAGNRLESAPMAPDVAPSLLPLLVAPR